MSVVQWACLFAACLAALSGCLADPMVGDCNMTYFISGGQKCQRKTMANLKHKPNTNCSIEYQHQTSCLTEYLTSCLTGLLSGFVPAVRSLIEMLFYHCGDLKVDPTLIDQFLLQTIQCKGEVFTKTVECWNDFRLRFDQDKTDPRLCRDYAVAKECVTEEAKTGCAIGQYINRDLFNPFCTYNTDPPLNSSKPTVLIGRCSTQTFALSAYKCQREMITRLAEENSATCRQEYIKQEVCLSSAMETCLMGTSLSPLKEEVRRLVQTVLYHCGTLTADKISVNSFLVGALNCNETMFQTAVRCWDDFRLRLILNRLDKQLCVDYALSKLCVSMAVHSGCAIGDLMEDDLYNPFCVDGIDPLSLPSTAALTSRRFTFVCDNDLLYKRAIVCENIFLEAIYSTQVTTSCREQSQTFLTCLKTQYAPCIGPSSNPILLEALALVVLQSVQGTQLLCESPIKQIIWDDLPPLLQTVASCDNDYAVETADCGRTFRSKFISVPSPLCEEFEDAKACVDGARRKFCSFSIDSRKTLMGNFNPFCDNRTRPLFTDVGSCLKTKYHINFIMLFVLSSGFFT